MNIIYLAKLPQTITPEEYSSSKYPWGFFGFYELIRLGNNVLWYTHSRNSWIYNFLKRKISKIDCYYFQLSCLRKVNKYDIIYVGDDVHLFLLAIFRALRLIKRPIFAVSHFTYNTKYVKSFLKRRVLVIERYLVYKYIDKLSFASERLLEVAKQDCNIPSRHQVVAYWGANTSYYDSEQYTHITPSEDFYLASGGTNRDYDTLVKCFESIPNEKLIINSKFKSYTQKVPNNIQICDKIKFDNNDFLRQRDQLHNCIAVCLPIKEINMVPNGATVMVEAMAMGKPIIISHLDTNFVDVEKEGIGLTVKIGDSEDWQRAINWMKENPVKRREMGKRALLLAKTKYNINNFAISIQNEMKSLI